MASSWCDTGLVALWTAALETPPATRPDTAQLIKATFTPSPALSYGSVVFEAGGTVPAKSLPGGWTYSLNTTTHIVTGSQLLSWTLGAGLAGNIYYGVGIYSATGPTLFYTETFPAPYTVPGAGGTLPFMLNMAFGDCAYA